MRVDGVQTVGGHLATAIKQRLVGRDNELSKLNELFQGCAEAPHVVSIIGGPGTGKTALTTALRKEIEDACEVHWIWCEHTRNTSAMQAALGTTTGLRSVIVLDAFEHLGDMGDFFFKEIFPKLSASTMVVLSSRVEMAASIRASLSGIHSTIRLDVLSTKDAKLILSQAGVAASEWDAIIELTSGLPLALMLAVEAARDGETFTKERAQDIVTELAVQLVNEAPSLLHQRALYAASVAAVDVTLLAKMLDIEDASEIYTWLMRRSYVRQTPMGLSPHEWVLDALYSDLVLRRPQLLGDLSRRASKHILTRLRVAPIDGLQDLIVAATRTRRDLPHVQNFINNDVGHTSLRVMSSSDLVTVRAAVERYEGAVALETFDDLYKQEPDRFFVTCDASDKPITAISFNPLRPEMKDSADPILRACFELQEKRGWPREDVASIRWFMALDGYQDFTAAMSSAMLSGPTVHTSLSRITRYGINIVEEPDRWEQLAPPLLMHRTEVTAEMNGRHYGLYVMDVAEHSAQWEDPGRLRYAMYKGFIEHLVGTRPPRPQLAREVFDAAVRDALNTLHQPAELSHNPLTRSLLVGETKQHAELKELLIATVETLRHTPNYEDLVAILERTYLTPAVKQRAAAADLGIPFGTYRYRLRRALELVAAALWEQETERRAS